MHARNAFILENAICLSNYVDFEIQALSYEEVIACCKIRLGKNSAQNPLVSMLIEQSVKRAGCLHRSGDERSCIRFGRTII